MALEKDETEVHTCMLLVHVAVCLVGRRLM